MSYFLCSTHESENVFLVVAELSSTTVKDEDIRGPLVSMQNNASYLFFLHHVSNCKWGEGMKNMQEITALNNLVLLNSDSFDLVPGP